MKYFCKKCNETVNPLSCGCCFDCDHGASFSDEENIEVRMSLLDLYHVMKTALSQEEFDLGRLSFDSIYFKVNEIKEHFQKEN